MSLAAKFKGQVFRLGRHIGDRNLARLRSALGYLEIGALTQSKLGSASIPMAADRFGVFEEALRHVSGTRTLYLEFGVFEGETMRWWASHVHPASARFVGFDSFEGLPETWRPGFELGQFETRGPPVVDDARVEFVTGWFEDSLAHFTMPPHDQLVVNVDSDLYSSAKTVLSWVAPHLTPGSLLYFDEFADRDHELRALEELLASTDLEVVPIAAGGGGAHFLFRIE